MREIKFRGLNASGEWVYGYLVSASHNMTSVPGPKKSMWIIERAWGNGGWFNAQKRQRVRVETVGEYTGLRDKNGREVWEGDIDQDGMIIAYCDGNNDFHGMAVGWYLQRNDFESWVELSAGLNVKIIGNIHKNPELLGGTHE